MYNGELICALKYKMVYDSPYYQKLYCDTMASIIAHNMSIFYDIRRMMRE